MRSKAETTNAEILNESNLKPGRIRPKVVAPKYAHVLRRRPFVGIDIGKKQGYNDNNCVADYPAAVRDEQPENDYGDHLRELKRRL